MAKSSCGWLPIQLHHKIEIIYIFKTKTLNATIVKCRVNF